MIDDTHNRLNNYEERISKLEDNTTKLIISSVENTAKLENIEIGQTRLEKSFTDESRMNRDTLVKLIDSTFFEKGRLKEKRK